MPFWKNIILSIMLLFLLLPYTIYGQKKDAAGWYLKKQENGISIYLRDAPNSRLKELKAVSKMNTSLASIVVLLSDWNSYPQWVYRCEKSQTLKVISENEVIHYQAVTAPWPVDNRDFIVDVKTSQEDNGVVHQRTQCLPAYIPLIAGYVRITTFNASWTLTPENEGTVNVEYQLLVDPGGNVPAWLVNLAVVEGPFETTSNMIEWVKKKEYKEAHLAYIKEYHDLH